MLKLWRTYVVDRKCADRGFQANPSLDVFCERFNGSLANMYFAMVENNKTAIEELVAEQKAIQEEGGEELKEYLAPYFSISKRWKAGEWGKNSPDTTAQGWMRFRTANNWRE